MHHSRKKWHYSYEQIKRPVGYQSFESYMYKANERENVQGNTGNDYLVKRTTMCEEGSRKGRIQVIIYIQVKVLRKGEMRKGDAVKDMFPRVTRTRKALTRKGDGGVSIEWMTGGVKLVSWKLPPITVIKTLGSGYQRKNSPVLANRASYTHKDVSISSHTILRPKNIRNESLKWRC